MDNISLSKLDYVECARYLGYKGSIPEENIINIIKECEEQLINSAVPRFLYKCFDVIRDENGILIKNTNIYLTGTSIKKHLLECNRIAIIAATLSIEVDKMIRLLEIKDMAKAVVMDALAAVAIEQLCDKIEVFIKIKEKEKNITKRFGIGYGDLPISLEPDLLKLLEAEKSIGLCSNESFTLTPKKSVLCIVGLGNTNKIKKSCDNCNMNKTCNYRRRGETCGI